eukprot:2443377-Karenia_brevis.AAC.1
MGPRGRSESPRRPHSEHQKPPEGPSSRAQETSEGPQRASEALAPHHAPESFYDNAPTAGSQNGPPL